MTQTLTGRITAISDLRMNITLDKRYTFPCTIGFFNNVRPTISVGDSVKIETDNEGRVKSLVVKEKAK